MLVIVNDEAELSEVNRIITDKFDINLKEGSIEIRSITNSLKVLPIIDNKILVQENK